MFDHPALQHPAYLVSHERVLSVYLVDELCIFFCLFSLYFKKFEQFIRVALTVGIISSGEGLHYHFRLYTYLLICILVLLQGEKRDEFYP